MSLPRINPNHVLWSALTLTLGFMAVAWYFIEQDHQHQVVAEIGRDFYVQLIDIRELVQDTAKGDRSPQKLVQLKKEITDTIDEITLAVSGGEYQDRYVRPVEQGHVRLELISYSNELSQLIGLLQQYESASSNAVNQSKIATELPDVADLLVRRAAHISDDIAEYTAAEQRHLGYVQRALWSSFALMLIIFSWMIRAYQRKDSQLSRELNKALRELDAQKYALDQHSIVAMTDVHGTITFVNDKFCEISGYARDELIGSTHRIINSGYHSKEFFAHLWRTISSGQVWSGQILNLAKTGRQYWVDTTIVPYKNEHGEIERYVAIRTDITARKEYEKAAYSAEQRLGRQNRILRELARAQNYEKSRFDEIVGTFTEAAARALNVSRVGVWLENEDRANLIMCLDVYDVAADFHGAEADGTRAHIGELMASLEINGMLSIADTGNSSHVAGLRRAGMVRDDASAILMAGVRVAGRIVGVVVFEEINAPRYWALDEQGFAASIADYVALALEADKRHRVETGLRAIAQISPTGDHESFFVELARQLAIGLTMDHVIISRFSKRKDRLRSLAVWDEGKNVDNFSYPAMGGMSNLARNISVSEQGIDVVLPSPGGGKTIVTAKSYVVSPISRLDGAVLGVIWMWSRHAIPSAEVAESMLQICAMRAAAELERIDTEERLQTIVDSMSDCVWDVDSDFRLSYCSDKITDILGYSVNELLGRSLFDLLNPADIKRAKQLLTDAVANRTKIRDEEFWLSTKRRKEVCVLCGALPVINDDDEFMGFRGVFSDITARKTAELRAKMLVTVIDQSMDGVVISDIDGNVEYANPAYLHLSHRSQEDVIGSGIEGLFGLDFKSLAHDEQQTAEAEDRIKYRRQVTRGEGSGYIEELSVAPIRDRGGGIVNYVVAVRDVTQEAIKEQRERQTQKLEAIGTLAGGIAHDFNNILSGILGFAELTRDEVPDESLAGQNLSQIIKAAHRAKDLVARILAFSRQSEAELTDVVPQEAVLELIALLRSTIPSPIEIKTALNAPQAAIRLESGQFQQLVMNLLVNAGQAIGERPGTIEVALDEVNLTENNVETLQAGEYVRLTIADDGCGMPPEVVARIFDPFFTTRPVGQGVGMGLASAHGIVSAAKGAIIAQSEVGKGSRFEVYLPKVKARKVDSPTPPAALRAAKERLLIVDDEELQTAVMRRMLERLGYHVTVSNRPRDALTLFAKNPDNFDLVITDQNMPEMTGDMLVRELMHIRPDVPIVMCTGYSQRVGPEEARQIGVRDYILKPVMSNDLNDVLSRVLNPHQMSD